MTIEPLYIDILVLVLTLLSAGIGLVRGFINEVFTIIGWVAALIVTYIAWPYSKDFLRQFFEQELIADIAAAVIVFVITLALVTIASHSVSDHVKSSRLGIVDRSLGFAFGLARAFIVFGLAFVLVAWVWEADDRPEWLTDAKSYPFLQTTGQSVAFMVPGSDNIEISDDSNTDALDKIMRPETSEKIREKAKDLMELQKGYNPEDRDSIDQLFKQSDN